ncbi:MAG: sugar phosphate isomerase/epimerase family protein [Bacillota bacterium]
MKLGSGVYYDLFQVNPAYYLEHFQHLELQDFVLPDNLDIHADKIIKGYQRLLGTFKGTLSMHGPFKQLFLSSMDRQVQDLACKRLSQALRYGKELGCSIMVVHSCYNPLMNYPGYLDDWVNNALWFWERFLPICAKQNMVITLENIWDKTPVPMLRVLKRLQSPFLRACLDTGHVNIFSSIPITEWISSLGDYLAHFHIHDNHGIDDEHLPPGRGNIDFSWLAAYKDDHKIALVNEAYGSIKEERAFLNFIKGFQTASRCK